jgi:hypothetical protein
MEFFIAIATVAITTTTATATISTNYYWKTSNLTAPKSLFYCDMRHEFRMSEKGTVFALNTNKC